MARQLTPNEHARAHALEQRFKRCTQAILKHRHDVLAETITDRLIKQAVVQAMSRKAAQNIQVLPSRLPRSGMVLSPRHPGSSSVLVNQEFGLRRFW
jgi:hypothetical protein